MKRPASASPPSNNTHRRKYAIEWSREQIVCDNGIEGAGRYATLTFKKHGGAVGAKNKADLWKATGKF